MSDNMNVSEFVQRFENGEFEDPSFETQCEAGWYDWFCKTTSLRNKTRALGKKVVQLANSEKVSGDSMYVFFKNNCPMNGPLYDDFRFCDLETGDVKYTVVPKSGHSGQAEVWGVDNDFNGPLVAGNWRDVRKFFGV